MSVYRLLTTESIDESICAVQEEKLALHNGVLQEGALAVGGDDEGDEKPAEVKVGPVACFVPVSNPSAQGFAAQVLCVVERMN